MVGNRHIATAQKGPERHGGGGIFTQHELYAIPTEFCDELATACLLFFAQARARVFGDGSSDSSELREEPNMARRTALSQGSEELI